MSYNCIIGYILDCKSVCSPLEKKIDIINNLSIQDENTTQQILKLGFSTLAQQNQQLLDSQDELMKANQELSSQILELREKFDLVFNELTRIKEEERKKEEIRLARKNRKCQQVTPEIYKLLIEEVSGKNYQAARLRLAFCLLSITGIRINELLPLKISQLQRLIKSNWIAIDPSKSGRDNHKAFLTPQGEKLLKDRTKDFELIFMLKEPDSYIFSPHTSTRIFHKIC